MADPRLKQIKIKTGIVRRIAKEKICYDSEANQQRARIQKMKDENKEEYDIRKQEEVLQESLMMVPDCQRRLEKAYEELKNILKNETDLQDSDEYSAAKKTLEEAHPLLPNPDENMPHITQSSFNIPSPFFSNSQFNSEHFGLTHNIDKIYMFDNGNSMNQKQKDEEFINSFVKMRVNKQITKRIPSTLKIFEAKKYLIDIIMLKAELELCSKALDISDSNFNAKWEEIVAKQKMVNSLLLEFDDDSIEFLKTSLNKRRKKRIWEKTNKIKHRNMKMDLAERSRTKHALIDKLLQEKGKEVESLKRSEALRRQADSVLHEVRRKKYEAKKMMNMLTALSSLRQVRSHREVAQGGYCSKEVSETFNNVINQFQNVWKKRSEMYNLEENGLKVMLEESEIPEMKISSIQKTFDQWEQAFFGTPSSDDNYKLLTIADYDINSFTLVRSNWDQYIVNNCTILSSSIPLGWVLPPQTPDKEWQQFLRSNKRKS